MKDLEKSAQEFRAWRGERSHRHYPKRFWDEIKKFTKKYPLDVIASTYNINFHYLQQKFPKKPKSIAFTSVEIVSFPAPVSIEFTNPNSSTMTVRFQANHNEIVDIIQSFTGQAK